MARFSGFCLRALVAGVALVAAASAVAQTPGALAPADAAQLAQAAGFRLAGREILNVCGKPASPKFSLRDLNGDGQPEAIVIDHEPACYGGAGDWFAILARGPGGQWRALVREVGTLRIETTRTRGWLDARVRAACEDVWHFTGTTYRPSQDCTPSRSEASRAPAAPAAPAATAALSQADRASILRQAGFTQRAGRWKGCDGDSTVAIQEVRDINRDGQLDAVVTESSATCYGATGQGFTLLTRGTDGQWRKLYADTGIPFFLTSGANGWPDVEIGGPGFCAPVLRWNGQTYVQHRNHETQRGACARR